MCILKHGSFKNHELHVHSVYVQSFVLICPRIKNPAAHRRITKTVRNVTAAAQVSTTAALVTSTEVAPVINTAAIETNIRPPANITLRLITSRPTLTKIDTEIKIKIR